VTDTDSPFSIRCVSKFMPWRPWHV